MKTSKKYWILYFNIFFFISFYGIFSSNPDLDIAISNFFFLKDRFLSEEYTFIKTIRTNLKYIMIFIPIISLIILVYILIDLKKKNIKINTKPEGFFLFYLVFLLAH